MAKAAGIGETTLSRWKDEHPELGAQLEQAREQCRRDTLARIKKAGQADWRADKAFLELSYQEYRQSNTRVEVKTAAQAGDVQIVADESKRKAMIEARERFLKRGREVALFARQAEIAAWPHWGSQSTGR